MKCKICHSNEIKYRGSKNRYKIYKCNSCDVEFVDPMPNKEELIEIYSNQKLNKWKGKHLFSEAESFVSLKSNPKRDWFDKVLQIVINKTKRKRLRILEVGCGKGVFIHYANSLNHDIVGTEASEEIVNELNKYLNGSVKFVNEGKFKEAFNESKFDLIYIEHVLEHLVDPVNAVKQFYHLLDKVGVLVIMVPNHNSVFFKERRIKLAWIRSSISFMVFHPK